LLFSLALASSAQAAQRYASPAGAGTECTQSTPCSFTQATTQAKAGDEVIVTTGTYVLPGPAFVNFAAANSSVHGDPGGPMPKIKGAFLSYLFYDGAPNSTVSYLEFENTGEGSIGLSCASGANVERVRSSVTGKFSTGIQMESCLVRDSLAIASGQAAVGLTGAGGVLPGKGTLINATAIASGPESVGVRSTYTLPFFGGSYDLAIRNTIASGSTDIETAGNGFGTGTATASHSNFDTTKEAAAKFTDGGGNQIAPPLFVNAAAGDYREAAGSPTIDAGIADPLAGALDLAGNARTQGGAIDIGAYEFVPPPLPTPPAPPVAQIQSLALAPAAFRTANLGGAVASGRKKAPIGSAVTYGLSAAGSVVFTVERKTTGRRVGHKCVKRTKANAKKKKCPLYKKIKGSFSVTGATGQNRFKFSGRLNNKALKPGRYRLVGSAGGVTKTASFRIVK
jgi:hypothetical protein